MFNVPIKSIIVAVIGASTLVSCFSDKTEEAEEKAAGLLNESRENFESGHYDAALLLLDSIDRSLPEAVKTRKAVSQFRPEVLERHTARQLSLTDSLMAVNAILGDSLRDMVEYVSNPIEGYYVVKGESTTTVRKNAGLHCRMSADFHYYIVATSADSRNATAVQLTCGGESVRSGEVPYDGERNSQTGTGVSITFTEAESEPLAEFIKKHSSDGRVVELTFINGDMQSGALTLSPEQVRSTSIICDLSRAIRNDKTYRIEKQRLQRQLEIVRQQIANTH